MYAGLSALAARLSRKPSPEHMPGLVGYIGKKHPKTARKLVASMLETITHEAFYASGVYSSADCRLHLGWSDQLPNPQPMPRCSKDGRFLLFVHSNVAPTSEETERFFHGCERNIEDSVRNLDGSFSIVLLRPQQCAVTIANDRYGMDRLYAVKGRDEFFFASEAKALLRVLPQESKLFDSLGLAQFMAYGCTFDGRSLFREVEVLPSGTLHHFVAGHLSRHSSYFAFEEWEREKAQDPVLLVEELKRAFVDAARRNLTPPEQVGLSLTGGFDSRMVLAAATDQAVRLPCYTFAGKERESFDAKAARRVSQKLNLPFEVLRIDSSFLAHLADYVTRSVYLSDGYLGVSGAAELRMNQLAREIAPIRITGNYGGELIRGVRTLSVNYDSRLFEDSQKKLAEVEINRIAASIAGMHPLTFVAIVHTGAQGYGRRAVEESQIVTRTPFVSNRLVQLLYRLPERLSGYTVTQQLLSGASNRLSGISNEQGYYIRSGKLRRSLRSFHRGLVFRSENRLRSDMPRIALVLAKRLPFCLALAEQKLLGRNKFYHLRPWLRDYLSEFVHDSIGDLARNAVAPSLSKAQVRRVLREHYVGTRDHSYELERLLCIAIAGQQLLHCNKQTK
jgi:asparagine synthase (glutamine-hydrolysing)